MEEGTSASSRLTSFIIYSKAASQAILTCNNAWLFMYTTSYYTSFIWLSFYEVSTEIIIVRINGLLRPKSRLISYPLYLKKYIW